MRAYEDLNPINRRDGVVGRSFVVMGGACGSAVPDCRESRSSWAAEGVPGLRVCSALRKAFPVILGHAGDEQLPLVAAAHWEKGRVVVFGHDGYLASDSEGGSKLLINAATWCADRPQNQVRLGVWEHARAAKQFKALGVDTKIVALDALEGIDVLVMNTMRLKTDDQVHAIQAFVKRGGGLITAGLGWAWLGYFAKGGDLADDFLGNRLLMPAGILFADGTLRPAKGKSFDVSADESVLAHAGQALAALVEHAAGQRVLKNDERSQCSAVLTSAARSLPDQEPLLAGQLDALMASRSAGIAPMDRKPLREEQALDRTLLVWQLRRLERMPVDRVAAHPAAADFPGAVPAQAQRVQQRVQIDPATHGWHSTGLYAAPGEAVTVVIPESMVGQAACRIGAHQDRLYHHDAWKRVPDITRQVTLHESKTVLASPFGGLLYIVIDKPMEHDPFAVEMTGAVRAPYYVHGETRIEDWQKTLRSHPAPWAELATKKLVITVPSEVIRALDDPAALMTVWDQVLDACADLATIPRTRPRPHRIVLDRQISAGYMHSGYPIMAHLDQQRHIVDRANLVAGNWGFFHELGHNHQHRDWTFDGTGEVTCNLFSLYVYETVCGVKAVDYARTSPKARTSRMDPYFKQPDFNTWKKDPFLALDMYVQLQEAFGWEPIKKVFAEYRRLPDAERPKSDDQKRDQWMVRFSRTVGKNLGPFFQTWAVPTSVSARNAIMDLPVWMPEGMTSR